MSSPLVSSRRGVSPVVGTVLTLAIVVALAAILGVLALGFETPSDPSPQFSYEPSYVADGSGNTNHRPYVTVTLTGGRIEPGPEFYVVDGDGNQVRWDHIWTTSGPLTAGDYAHLDGYGSDAPLNPACEGEVYRMVHRPEAGDSSVILEIEITAPAVGAAASHC
jgi:flagellin-like protein